MYSIFRDGRRQDGQPDGKTGIKRPEQIVRDRIETEQDIEVWTRTRSYSAAPTPMRRNIIFNEEQFKMIPDSIKQELHVICVLFTEEVGGVFYHCL